MYSNNFDIESHKLNRLVCEAYACTMKSCRNVIDVPIKTRGEEIFNKIWRLVSSYHINPVIIETNGAAVKKKTPATAIDHKLNKHLKLLRFHWIFFLSRWIFCFSLSIFACLFFSFGHILGLSNWQFDCDWPLGCVTLIGFWLNLSRFCCANFAPTLFNRQLWILTENMYLH